MSDNESPFHRGEKAIQSRLGIQEKMEKVGRKLIRATERYDESLHPRPLRPRQT
jgi:hypothetical protein